MLGEVTEKFDEKFYKQWKTLASQALKDLERGLNKMDLPPPLPTNLKLVQQDILDANQAKTGEEYVAALTKLQRHLDRIVKLHEFNDPDVNIFFIQARRTYNSLLSFTFRSILNDYNKYLAGFMNPSEKAQPNQVTLSSIPLGGIPRKIVSIATQKVASQMLLDARREIIDTFSAQAENLPSHKTNSGTFSTNTNKNLSHCLLQRQIGETNYFASNQDGPINSPEEATTWLGKEIYRFSFDHFYTQCAQLYEALVKVESIAGNEQNPDEAKRKKQDLLRELKMEELGSSASLDHLTQMAKHLGFANIQDLHHNFRNLDTQTGFKDYNLKKQSFVSFASDMDIEAPDDPLEMLKKNRPCRI